MFQVLEVVLDDDVSDSVKDELDVVGVRSTCEVRINLLRLSALVQVLKLFLDVRRRLVVSVHACTYAQYIVGLHRSSSAVFGRCSAVRFAICLLNLWPFHKSKRCFYDKNL